MWAVHREGGEVGPHDCCAKMPRGPKAAGPCVALCLRWENAALAPGTAVLTLTPCVTWQLSCKYLYEAVCRAEGRNVTIGYFVVFAGVL